MWGWAGLAPSAGGRDGLGKTAEHGSDMGQTSDLGTPTLHLVEGYIAYAFIMLLQWRWQSDCQTPGLLHTPLSVPRAIGAFLGQSWATAYPAAIGGSHSARAPALL